VGEGEHPTLDLARALAEGRDVTRVTGLRVRHDGRVVNNQVRPLLQELDRLPFPAYLRPDTWFIEDNRLLRRDPIEETVEYRIYPTRGCPYRCNYCHSHVLRRIVRDLPGRFYRLRSVENVMAELEYARRILPRIRRVKFDGDVFAFPKGWISEFSAHYQARIGIPFELLTYPGELDLSDLKVLKRAGLRKIQTGIQSGSDREVQEAYGRSSTAGDVLQLSRAASEAGVEIAFDLMFDNPLATEDDRRALVELMLRLERPFSVYLYSLTLFPETELTRELLEAGVITPDQVEGAATKSFTQFRLSLDYPRDMREEFWICLAILAAKSFIPPAVIRHLMDSPSWRRRMGVLRTAARLADLTKAAAVAGRMLLDGELTLFKLRQYGSLKKVISL